MTNREDWIQTYTGKAFYPFDPQPEDICIEDIAHALSMTCRYNGHVTNFYSVAEHSVLVSRIVPPHLALTGLLHDASEAYVADVSTPVKKNFPEYRAMEDRIMWTIADKFGTAYPDPDEIKHADLVALATEKRDLMLPEPQPWIPLPPPLEKKIVGYLPFYAEDFFLNRFYYITLGLG